MRRFLLLALLCSCGSDDSSLEDASRGDAADLGDAATDATGDTASDTQADDASNDTFTNADASLTLGDESLFVTGELAEDAMIVVGTDGSINFGSAGPTLAMRMSLNGLDDGQQVEISHLEGTAEFTSSGLVVEEVAELPYSRAVRVGTPNPEQNGVGGPRIRASHAHATEIYEAVTIYWPAEHQDASVGDLNETATWQIKSIWHFNGEGGHGAPGVSDYFGGLPSWIGSREYWGDNGKTIASNSRPTSTAFNGGSTGVIDPEDRTRWRAQPLYRQIWARHGPDTNSAEMSDGMVRLTDASEGVVVDFRYPDNARWDEAGGAVGVDRFTFPGFTRGFHTGLNRHVFFSDVYVTHSAGPGAAARIELGDSDEYAECHHLSVFNIINWTDTEVQAQVRLGYFHGRDLSGLSLYLTDANNETQLIGTIP